MPDDIKQMGNETTKEDHGQTLAEWTFPEFTKYKKTRGWYFGITIFLLVLVLVGIFTQSYLFLLIIALVILIYYIRSRREPATINFGITEDGLEVGEAFYPYKNIKNFWIIYEPPEVKNLYVSFKVLRPSLSIALLNQNPIKIRKILLNYLQEDLTKENESFADGLMRMLKL